MNSIASSGADSPAFENSQAGNVNLFREPTLFDKLKNIASVSQILRMFGAAAVIVSMSLFMLQGWSEGNDITRYLKLLGQTGLLTGVGLILSFLIKEYKGARVFFGLSLFSVVANFTILGALTFSMVQWDAALIDYPSMMKWVVVDTSTFMMTFVGAFALLAIVSRFSFSIFARNIAGTLTVAFLIMCSLLLIPVRSSIVVCLIAGISIWASIMITNRLRQNDKVALTREAKFALSLLYLPGLIMVVRAVSLYKIDDVMLMSLCSLAYFSFRALIARIDVPSISTRVLEITQYGLGIFLSLLIVDLLPFNVYAYKPMLVAALVGGLLVDQLMQSKDKGWSSLNLNFTSFALVFSYLWFSLFNGHIEWQLSGLFASGLMLTVSWFVRSKLDSRQIANISAVIGLIASALMLGTRLVELANLSNWMLIGLGGVLLIVGASLYERYGLAFMSAKPRNKQVSN